MFLPGHNVEATFLVHDAYAVLGLPGPPESWTTDILEEAESRMQLGPQGERWLPHILVNDSGDASNEVAWRIGDKDFEAEINWWAQMELFNALVHADQRLGGPDGSAGDKYIERAMHTWQLVATRFVSPSTGALYETLEHRVQDANYFQGQGEGFGKWKASYHSTRALIRSLQALREGLKAVRRDYAQGITGAAPAA
jgi:mannose/cellobiose epimerase-like protein (N-acyl-D-glucosamine 2-epimerase family)